MIKPVLARLLLSAAIIVPVLTSTAVGASDDDPWDAIRAGTEIPGGYSLEERFVHAECSWQFFALQISCDQSPVAVGTPVTVSVGGLVPGSVTALKFYREMSPCASDTHCFLKDMDVPIRADGSGNGTYIWDTTSEQATQFRLCLRDFSTCETDYVTAQLLPADVVTPGAYGPDTCIQGYVWREAFTADHVCVTPDIRAQAAVDNSQASARWNLWGPDACMQGYVWREAFSGDHVCVAPDIRTAAAADNRLAAARKNPGGGPYGPDTCLVGYVWRDASAQDHVCVTSNVRAQAAADNSQAGSRRDPLAGPLTYGRFTCRLGWVWREASAQDRVCVTPDVRDQTAFDNSQASFRVVSP